MQLHSINRDVQSSGTMEVSRAKIKATRKIFDMFADQTYANKPVAILRELVANGVDAHTAAGKPDTPVEITMPSEFDPMFKVKDFGTGMPHEFVMGPFMEYTNGSTKDQSNDQIGGFGIGSKSPFAYCDQFTLRVVHNGVLSVYTMFKDEEGIPAIGLQGQKTTDESNGVEVSFPVEMNDMEDFKNAAQEALQYFNPLPTVIGGTLIPPAYTHVSKKKHWAMKASPDGTLGVIMGGVRYPVTADNLTHTLRNDAKLSPLLNYGIDLTLPIGTCEVAMSREALSYTERTNKAIETALRGIVDEVADTFAHLFDKAATYWEAQVELYKQLHAIAGNVGGYNARHNPRANMMKSFARWKGADLKVDTQLGVTADWDSAQRKYVEKIPPGYPDGAQLWIPMFHSWRKTNPTPKFEAMKSWSKITPGEFKAIFIDDMEIAAKSRTAARIVEYMEGNNIKHSQVLVLRAAKNQDKASITALLNYLGSPQKVTYLSTLPEPARKVRTVTASDGSTYVRPKIRMFTFNGDRDRYGNQIINLSPAHSKRDAVKEIADADQPDKGIVVPLQYWSFDKKLYQYVAAGVLKWDELHFANEGDAKRLDKKRWQRVDDVLAKRIKKLTSKHPLLAEMLWVDKNTPAGFAWIEEMKKGGLVVPKDKLNTSFGKFVALYDKYVVPYTDEAKAVALVLATQPAKPNDFDEKLNDQWQKDHPWAVRVYRAIHWYMNRKDNVELFVHNL